LTTFPEDKTKQKAKAKRRKMEDCKNRNVVGRKTRKYTSCRERKPRERRWKKRQKTPKEKKEEEKILYNGGKREKKYSSFVRNRIKRREGEKKTSKDRGGLESF
jgi:hypothetical protein